MAILLTRFQTLERYVRSLGREFVDRFIPANPADKPTRYEHCVKAYCVLAHAAFEEYVEKLSLDVVEDCQKQWLNQRRCNNSLITLCTCHKIEISFVDNELERQDRCFDMIRVALDVAKKRHSDMIFDNHGFALSYLRKIFTPIGIDVPDDPIFNGSLQILTQARGSFAHKVASGAIYTDRAKAENPLSPEDAKRAVDDCLRLCHELTTRAKNQTTVPKPRPKRKTAKLPG